MKRVRTTLHSLVLTILFLALVTPCLVGCGGGGGGDKQPAPSGQQGIRFLVDKSYNQMVYSVDATGPSGKVSHTLGLSPGQEMFIAMPPGTYTLDFWIYAGGGMSVIDLTPRHATVQPSQVTQVIYP